MSGRLGELLVGQRRITHAQLQEALARQETHGGRLGSTLVTLGYLRNEELTSLLSRQYSVPCIDLAQFEIDPAVLELLPAELAQRYRVVPLNRSGSVLTIAMADPTNVSAMDDIKFWTGCTIEPVVACESALLEAIGRYYGGRPRHRSALAQELAGRTVEELPAVLDLEVLEELEDLDLAALERQGGEAPVIRLVNLILMSAVQKGASDVHVEPYEREFRVRFRIDGMLHHAMAPPMTYRDAITARVKIMAKLDIAEKRLPQDGRIKIRLHDRGQLREIDFRVSSLPTLFGEKLVLRLLDRQTLRLDMAKLGFEPASLGRFEAAIERPWGLVLVTGPTGSGKTSTLYSSIARINTPETNIVTVEDPVEFNLPGVNQVQVRESIGLDFATALRAFLRQDPNVILVGEIRDGETAAIAIKAALTGHLVLSTLHTNDAPGTVHRLMNMGIEPFLAAGSTSLVCAQRLVRRICGECRVPAVVPRAVLLEVGFGPDEIAGLSLYRGAGCDRCGQTGYRGRTGLFEVMEITEEMRRLILTPASASELRRQAIAEGMVTLRRSGLDKIRAGVTTIEEVVRETVA